MRATAQFLGAMFILATGLSWLSWTSAEIDTSTRAAIVLDYGEEDLAELVYHADAYTVKLERREDDLGVFVWAQVSHTRTDGVTLETEFQAGNRLVRALRGLAPLKAIRVLPAASDAAFAGFGFSEASPRLEIIDHGGRRRTVIVGGSAADPLERYVAEAGQRRQVWLVDNYLVAPFLKVTDAGAIRRLQASSLVGVRHWHAEAIRFTQGAEVVELEHRHIEDLTARHWVRRGQHTGRSPVLAAFAEAVCGLKIERYLTAEEWPNNITIKARFSVVARDGRRVEVELWSDAPDLPKTAQEATAHAWFARSNHARGRVRVDADSLGRLAEGLTDLSDDR